MSCFQNPEGKPVNITRIGSVAAIAIAATIVLSSCAANESAPSTSGSAAPVSKLSGTVNGIGSSAQGAAETAWIAGFQTSNPKVTINYDPQGSGAGRTSFISGAAAFAGSDAALKDSELATPSPLCKAGTKAIDLPIYISPIAIAYNVAGLTDLKLDAATIAGIFKGAITKWDDPAIKSLNSGATLPSAVIVVSTAQLKVGSAFVKINAAGAADVVAKSPTATGRGANDLAIAIDRKNTDNNAWPLVLVSYMIVCNTYADPAKGELVKAYAQYAASSEGQAAAKSQAGSAPLSKELAATVAKAIATIK
jgi:phosphate transport system substrate-binding protein